MMAIATFFGTLHTFSIATAGAYTTKINISKFKLVKQTYSSVNNGLKSENKRQDEFQLSIKSLFDVLIWAGVSLSVEKWHVNARRDEGNEKISDAVPKKHYSKVVDLGRGWEHCDRRHERSCQGQGDGNGRHLKMSSIWAKWRITLAGKITN